MTKKWNRKKTAILIAGIAGVLLVLLLIVAVTNRSTESRKQTDASKAEPTEQNIGPAVALTEHEQEIIQTMENEIKDIGDDVYAETVSDMIAYPGKYSGQLCRLEGVYEKDEEWPRITRTIVKGKKKEPCGLPMKYIKKEISDGAWIRITGVISEEKDENGSSFTTIEVLTIESLETPGKQELSAGKS